MVIEPIFSTNGARHPNQLLNKADVDWPRPVNHHQDGDLYDVHLPKRFVMNVYEDGDQDN